MHEEAQAASALFDDRRWSQGHRLSHFGQGELQVPDPRRHHLNGDAHREPTIIAPRAQHYSNQNRDRWSDGQRQSSAPMCLPWRAMRRRLLHRCLWALFAVGCYGRVD